MIGIRDKECQPSWQRLFIYSYDQEMNNTSPEKQSSFCSVNGSRKHDCKHIHEYDKHTSLVPQACSPSQPHAVHVLRKHALWFATQVRLHNFLFDKFFHKCLHGSTLLQSIKNVRGRLSLSAISNLHRSGGTVMRSGVSLASEFLYDLNGFGAAM